MYIHLLTIYTYIMYIQYIFPHYLLLMICPLVGVLLLFPDPPKKHAPNPTPLVTTLVEFPRKHLRSGFACWHLHDSGVIWHLGPGASSCGYHTDVSENGGYIPPKSSIFNRGFPLFSPSILGCFPTIFGNIPYSYKKKIASFFLKDSLSL